MSEREFAREYGSLSSVPLVGRSLFDRERAAAFVGFVERRLGKGVRLRGLTIYAADAMFDAVTPARPKEMDTYVYADGVFTSILPVRLSGGERLDEELFDLAGVAIEHLPDMIDRGCAETRPGRGATPYAVWRREGSALGVAVFCDSPRRSGGYVLFDPTGKFLGVRR